MPFRASEDLGYDAPPLLVLLALIHRSAWNKNSAKFAVASSPTRAGSYGVGVGLCGVSVAFWQHARLLRGEES